MAAATAWWGGGAGLGVRVVDGVGAAGGGEGTPVQAGGAGEGRHGGGGRTTLGAVTAGFGRMVKGVRVGASVTGVEARRGGDRDATAVLDLGAAAELGPVTVGMSGGGLGPSLELPTWGGEGEVGGSATAHAATDERLHSPWARAGFGTSAAPLGPLDVAAAGGVTVREGYRPRAAIGVEVGWWPVVGRTFVGRVGLESGRPADTSPWSVGAGFLGDSFTLEYGVRPRADGGRVHGVALRLR